MHASITTSGYNLYICGTNIKRMDCFIRIYYMANDIKIPNVDRDDRIGSAFNHLFQVIIQTESRSGESLRWDLKDASFFHPFYLAPLAIYKQSCDNPISCINKPGWIAGYLSLVRFENPLLITEDMDLKAELDPYISRSYIPVCKFELCKSNIDSLQTVLQKVICRQSRADYRIVTPLSYLLGELVDNMNEHSKGKYGYIFAQYLKKEGCIDLVVADDGMTIFSSYIRSGKYLDEINGDEAKALKLATEGKSTKNLPGAENRGYGLSSSKDMLVNGLHGSFFILSGGAFHRHDAKGSVSVKLPETINWNGTIILMRIPVQVPVDFDYNVYVR